MALTPNQLRDKLRELENVKPTARVLAPWVKGHRLVTGFHIDEDGNVVLETQSAR